MKFSALKNRTKREKNTKKKKQKKRQVTQKKIIAMNNLKTYRVKLFVVSKKK